MNKKPNYCSVCGISENETPKFYYKSKFGNNLCNKHYIQLRRHGKIIRGLLPRKNYCEVCDQTAGKLGVCYVKGEHYGKTLCVKHLAQIRTKGKLLDKFKSHKNKDRICEICDSTNDVIYHRKTGKMICRRHYSQLRTYGKFLKLTVFDRNQYVVLEDDIGQYAEIFLRNSKNENVAITKVDILFLDKIIKHKWGLGTWGYAYSRIKNKYTMLQTFIMKTKEMVDHIDRDTLNNRIYNLRIANKSLNSLNTGIRANNSSGITGVSFTKKISAWRSYINWQGKRIELGNRKHLNDAIKLRLAKEKELMGNTSPQRYLFGKYGI